MYWCTDLYVVTVNDCGELIKQSFYKHAFFTSYIHDTNKRQIHVNYYMVESIIHIKFNCHNGAKCQSMLHRSQRTDSSWRRTGGILSNLANRAGSCDRRRNSRVEQSRETCTFCWWPRRDCRDSTTRPDVSSLPSWLVWCHPRSREAETTFWDSHNDSQSWR